MRIVAVAVLLAIGPVDIAYAAEDPDATTCAQFVMLPVDDQVTLLSTLEPLGDEMNATDAAASKDWAAAVTAACRDNPDRLLPEAARAALGD